MTMFIISCALSDLRYDYRPLWRAMEAAGAKRAMESVWLLDTLQSIEEVAPSILSKLPPGDRLFVAEVGRWSATRLLDDVGHWLFEKHF